MFIFYFISYTKYTCKYVLCYVAQNKNYKKLVECEVRVNVDNNIIGECFLNKKKENEKLNVCMPWLYFIVQFLRIKFFIYKLNTQTKNLYF